MGHCSMRKNFQNRTMKLLLIAEKIDKNDEIFGYLHGRILDLLPRVEKITILCLEKGEHLLPSGIQIFSLGKERGQSKFNYLSNFYHFILAERKNYDTVFVHMAPIWVILGSLYWRLSGKRVVLWYSHRFIDWKLRLAIKLSSVVFVPENSVILGYNKKVLTTNLVDLESLALLKEKN